MNWWHDGIYLGKDEEGEIITKGRSSVKRLVNRIDLLPLISGKRILDVGCWDGGVTWECMMRGADVTAVDHFVWTDEIGTGRAGFDLCWEVYCGDEWKRIGKRVEVRDVDVLDMTLDTVGMGAGMGIGAGMGAGVGSRYDIVLFLGILYHMRHPLLALERIFDLVTAGGKAIVETYVCDQDEIDLSLGFKREVPMMRFYPGQELRGDPSNWWGPNIDCVDAMLRDVGFRRVIPISHVGDRVCFHAIK